MAEINQAKLRLYKLLLVNVRIAIEDIPEPYKSEINKDNLKGV